MEHETFIRPLGVIFDCDGVMIDSKDSNIAFYNQILHLFGKPPMTLDQERFAQMVTADQAIRRLLTSEEYLRLSDISAELSYRESVLPTLAPMPGFESFARWLKGQGVRLAVHTNRTEGIYDVLTRFGWTDIFEIVKNVRNAEPKPDPDGAFQILWEWGFDPSDVLFVGDSDTDLGAARGAGIPFVAYRNTTLDAEWHVDSFMEFKENLKNSFALSDLEQR